VKKITPTIETGTFSTNLSIETTLDDRPNAGVHQSFRPMAVYTTVLLVFIVILGATLQSLQCCGNRRSCGSTTYFALGDGSDEDDDEELKTLAKSADVWVVSGCHIFSLVVSELHRKHNVVMSRCWEKRRVVEFAKLAVASSLTKVTPALHLADVSD
jgi:hypothetical protein